MSMPQELSHIHIIMLVAADGATFPLMACKELKRAETYCSNINSTTSDEWGERCSSVVAIGATSAFVRTLKVQS